MTRRKIDKKEIKKIKAQKYLISFLGLGLVIYLSFILVSQQLKISNLKSIQEEQLLSEKKLDEDIGRLKKEGKDTDNPEIIEKLAREELGMIKPDETIIKDISEREKSELIQPSLDN